jgi:hypothetical protein
MSIMELRVEAITHNSRDLGCGRVLERFPEITTHLAAIGRGLLHHHAGLR